MWSNPRARAAVDCGETDLRGYGGGDCGGKCLWRKAIQPWKQGDAAESRVVDGAIAIASLPTHQHQQLNNREAGPSDPDVLNYRPGPHPGHPFKWLMCSFRVGPQAREPS